MHGERTEEASRGQDIGNHTAQDKYRDEAQGESERMGRVVFRI